MRIQITLVLTFFLCGSLAWAQGKPSKNPAQEIIDEAKNSFIFVFDPDKIGSANEVPGLARGLLKKHGGQLRHVFNKAILGFSATLPPGLAKRLAESSSNIKYYEQNGVVRAIGKPVKGNKKPEGTPGGGKGQKTEPPQVTPYGVTRSGGPANGQGLHAWVIDSGIDLNQPDLEVGPGANFVLRGKNSTNDRNGHGTHVAGTIGAKDNSIGVVGVAAGATVHPIRVLDNNGSGTIDGVVKGIDYVSINGKSGDCANLSLGAKGHWQSLHDAVVNAANAGILFSIAAGNEAGSATDYAPAHVEHANVYTVSAIDSSDEFANFSNWGNPPVDNAAPGVGILSTQKGGGVTTLSGTSMAAPHVCGVLLLVGKPNVNGFAVNDPDGTPDPIASK